MHISSVVYFQKLVKIFDFLSTQNQLNCLVEHLFSQILTGFDKFFVNYLGIHLIP